MRSIVISHKTIEEAIEKGLSELELSLEEVRVEVLDEGNRGLFGMFGSRQASVRLTEREEEEDALFNEPAAPEPPAKKPERPPSPKPAAAPGVEKPREPSREREARVSQPRPEQPRPPRPARRSSEERRNEHRQGHRENTGPLAPGEAQQTLAFLQEVSSLMGVEAQIETYEREGTLCFDITGDEKGVLIGHRGETLDSLQYLASLVKNKNDAEYRRVQVDVQGYRKKREETLIRLAHRIAERAYRSGRKVSLEPMNPYERRILHSALQDHAHVTTFSEGEEPNRRVVVAPK